MESRYITETGYDYTDSYWNHKGELSNILPDIEKNVSKYRDTNPYFKFYGWMANFYYDLYNNGLCNKSSYINEIRDSIVPIRKDIKPLLKNPESYKRIYDGRKDYEAFEDMLNASIQLAHSALPKLTNA